MSAVARAVAVALALGALACAPGPVDGWGDAGETGEACHADWLEQGGKLWAKACTWPAHAHAVDVVALGEALEQGLLLDVEGIGRECYSSPHAGAGTVCVVELDGVLLWGRPEGELTLSGSSCSEAGAWSVAVDASGRCVAVVDGVAVLLLD